MMHPTQAGIGLIRLGESGFVPANVEDDLRGKDYAKPPHGNAVTPQVAGATSTPRSRSTTGRSSRAVLMRATHMGPGLPEASHGVGYPDAVWGVRGVMAEAILPDRPAERRKRRRLCAMRAMERLGLLGEENLIPTLARRPEVRWLADEAGARWDVLAELGRIGQRDAFDEAVEWALKARPRPEEARARFFGVGTGARRHDGGVGSDTRGTVASRTPSSLLRLRGATPQEEEGRR